jgi:hypothetical protein
MDLPIEDVVELSQLSATYAVKLTQGDIHYVIEHLCTDDGTYRYLSPHRCWLAARRPHHELPASQRRCGLGQRPRPASTHAHTGVAVVGRSSGWEAEDPRRDEVLLDLRTHG